MNQNRTIVNTKDAGGNPLELAVLKPTNKIAQEANMAYNMKVSNLIRKGSDNGERLLLRSEVEDHLIKSGIWTTQDAVRIEQIGLRIRACELILKKGGIHLSQARKVAIKMGEMRNEAMELYKKRQQLDATTIEAVAEQYRFDFLVARCTVCANTGKPYFMDYQDYINRGDEEAAVAAAKTLAEILYGPFDVGASAMFEVQWLKEAGLMNEHGRYTDRKGRFIDQNGKLINESGRFIDEQGNLIDIHGRPVDENGKFIVDDPKPFVDDDTGKPIYIGEQPKPIKKSKKRKKQKV